ncbi:hypothetical protein P9869_42010 [Streptomyces ossamyceticus]|nr:hypothetical protein [Streptomyces ossamyceticus]
MAAGPLLFQRGRGLGCVGDPADQGDREGRTRGRGAGHRSGQHSGEDRRHRRHHFPEPRSDLCGHAEQQPGERAHRGHREGHAHRAQRSVAEAGQQVAAEGVRAERVCD